MNQTIRVTTTVRNHLVPEYATACIPHGVELEAYIDDNSIAWVPYQGETYMVFPTEYEPVTAG